MPTRDEQAAAAERSMAAMIAQYSKDFRIGGQQQESAPNPQCEVVKIPSSDPRIKLNGKREKYIKQIEALENDPGAYMRYVDMVLSREGKNTAVSSPDNLIKTTKEKLAGVNYKLEFDENSNFKKPYYDHMDTVKPIMDAICEYGNHIDVDQATHPDTTTIAFVDRPSYDTDSHEQDMNAVFNKLTKAHNKNPIVLIGYDWRPHELQKMAKDTGREVLYTRNDLDISMDNSGNLEISSPGRAHHTAYSPNDNSCFSAKEIKDSIYIPKGEQQQQDRALGASSRQQQAAPKPAAAPKPGARRGGPRV